MGRVKTKTKFKSPPIQTERNKKINAKFKLAHDRRDAERLISFKNSHQESYNQNVKKDLKVLWSKNSFYRWW